VELAPRSCEGCHQPLPPDARPNRRYHDSTCRKQGQRARAREELERRFATDQHSALRREALDQATAEDVLLLQIAKAAAGGSVRASIFLLERFHPVGAVHEPEQRQVDELARLRQLHAQLETGRR
jgi:hypothetical protein